jgi:hypothetical protein
LAETTTPEKGDLDEIARTVRQVIEDNRKFLDRIMDDEFEPENEPDNSLTDP